MQCEGENIGKLRDGSLIPAEPSRRIFLRLAAAVGLGLIAPAWLPRRAAAAFHVGDVPEQFTLIDIRGKSVVIPSDFRRQVVLIHFWASWCPTCRGEMTALASLYGKYGAKGVTPCSIGLGEKRETAVSYLKNMTIAYPVLLDPDSSTRKPFGVAGIPTYFLLDREMVIRHKILGKADWEGVDKIIKALL
jgi:cytochrome c biogenesis protein CcmG, thiol:disulfide interchange protein DsbE